MLCLIFTTLLIILIFNMFPHHAADNRIGKKSAPPKSVNGGSLCQIETPQAAD
jgi:hypothetical protein